MVSTSVSELLSSAILGWNWSTTIIPLWHEFPGPFEFFGFWKLIRFTDQVSLHQLELGCKEARVGASNIFMFLQ